ncbi:MAG TPA: hypothetical protein H9808_01240 [Candidatus Atopostipes pullistercoris]|uniref:Uncharacterized protein n=1 Tax=Candidatus Atopostipes pullistercoris TaxID=2838467 RepID=A0A9D2FZP9_9LACT|nr:hypothetical protein [Candidatus Atopostipes pullistercoris]
MGLFDFFKKQNKTPEVKVSFSSNIYDDSEYYELLRERPMIDQFTGRPFDFPTYTDEYNTRTPYKLRELLLFVWWGNTKTGRKASVNIPKYFFNDYNLDGRMLTSSFITSELLLEEKGKIKLTDKGQILFEEFYPLWEIHSVKNFPMNLDMDFPNWDKEEFDIKYYESMIRYYQAEATHSSKIIDYIKNHPDFDDIGNQEQYHLSNRDSCLMKVKDFKEKLAILKRNKDGNYPI